METATKTDKIKMVRIEIGYSESGLGKKQGGDPIVFTSWEDANALLRKIAESEKAHQTRLGVPDGEWGYCKTDFKVVFEDGEEYEGRMDVKPDYDDTDIQKHMTEFCRFYTGEHKPHWMTEEQYKNALQYTKDETKESFKKFLERYEF